LANKKIYLKIPRYAENAATTKDMLEIQEKSVNLKMKLMFQKADSFYRRPRELQYFKPKLIQGKNKNSATSKIGLEAVLEILLRKAGIVLWFHLRNYFALAFLLLIPVFVFLWRKWKGRNKK
jgi:hypothetical protein